MRRTLCAALVTCGLALPAFAEDAASTTVPVGVSRVDGRLCRVSGVCPHMGGILSWNRAERSWDCPLHGSRFDAGGALLEGPAVDDLSRTG